MLRLAGGDFEGLPFSLQPSQAFIIGSLFGWKRADGTRRFRRAYIEQGKGNGKSPLAAGVGLYMMMADKEARAEVYAAASKRDQAMILFRDAVSMVEMSPDLEQCITKSGRNPVWQLTDIAAGSFFKVLSSEDGQSGPRPSCGLLDEIHEMANRLVKSMIERGFKHRKQPLLFMITNSGFDRNSVCWEEHEHATRVAAGTRTPDTDFTFVGEPVDDSTFSYVCAGDKDDDPLEDPSCWIKSNPLLGVTMKPEQLAAAVRQANDLPGERNNVLRLNFCVWTESHTVWMARPLLEAVLHDFDPEKEHAGKDVYAGLDLSAAQDLTGKAFVVPTGYVEITKPNGEKQELPTFDAWIEGWTPADTIRERGLRDKAPYDVWVQKGFLNSTPGKIIRQDFVAARLAEITTIFNLKCLAYDQYSFREFKNRLDEAGLTVETVWHPQGGQRRARAPDAETAEARKQGLSSDDAGWPQGLWMPGSLTELETLILEGRIRLRSNPVLISACMSAAVQQDKLMGNRWLSKSIATNRIDVLIALLMAVGAATRATKRDVSSVYDTPGFVM